MKLYFFWDSRFSLPTSFPKAIWVAFSSKQCSKKSPDGLGGGLKHVVYSEDPVRNAPHGRICCNWFERSNRQLVEIRRRRCSKDETFREKSIFPLARNQLFQESACCYLLYLPSILRRDMCIVWICWVGRVFLKRITGICVMELLGAALATLKGAPNTFPAEDFFGNCKEYSCQMAVGHGMK